MRVPTADALCKPSMVAIACADIFSARGLCFGEGWRYARADVHFPILVCLQWVSVPGCCAPPNQARSLAPYSGNKRARPPARAVLVRVNVAALVEVISRATMDELTGPRLPDLTVLSRFASLHT